MKFLFITTIKEYFVKVWLCQQTSAVKSLVPPVDLVSIGTVLQKNGHKVKIVDLRLEKKPLAVYQEIISKFKPEVALLNLTTPSAESDYRLLEKIPKGCYKVVFGTHAIAFPNETFAKGVDFVLYGDPEKAIVNLLKTNFSKNGTVGVLTINKLQNKPALYQDLDQLPFLDLSLFDFQKYYIPYVRSGRRFTFLLSARGCPFNCTFCQNPFFFGKPYRRQTVKRMVAELKYLNENYQIDDFIYLDATFNVSEEKVIEFCQEIIRQKLKITWLVNVRVSPLSMKMLKLMKKAGCCRLMFGVEDYELLDDIKKEVTKKQILQAFAKTKKFGLKADAYLMIFPDLPWGEKEYVEHMLSILKEINPDGFQCNVAIPLPGTPFFKKLATKNKLSKQWNLYDAASGYELPYACQNDLFKIRRMVYLYYPFINITNSIKVLLSVNPRSLLNLIKKYFEYLLGTFNL